jgi:hypothetical protein
MRQYYLYARGDGKADLWRKRHVIRYATYVLGLPLIAGLMLSGRPSAQFVGAGLGVLGASAYLNRPYRRLPAVLQAAEERGALRRTRAVWIKAILWIPVIRAAGDFAKMAGYPVGWWWRLKQRPNDWRL